MSQICRTISQVYLYFLACKKLSTYLAVSNHPTAGEIKNVLKSFQYLTVCLIPYHVILPQAAVAHSSRVDTGVPVHRERFSERPVLLIRQPSLLYFVIL